MRGPSTLTLADRELIGARVSYLNDCHYCRDSHAAIAACHLGDDAVVASVVADPETADISSKMKALLAVAAKVQRGGGHVSASDIARARAEGATDLEIHDTVLIAAAFCMFNRYVDGLGTWTPDDPASYRERAAGVARDGYHSVLKAIGTAE